MRECSELIQSYTYPLLVDVNGVPDLIASCFFLELSGHVFMVTASHVLRRRYGSGLMTRGRGRLAVLRGAAAVTGPAHSDHLDIAILKLDPQFADEQDFNPVPTSMFAGLANIRNAQARAVCGYPISKNKRGRAVDRRKALFTARIFTFFGNLLDGERYRRFRKSPLDHVGLDYRPPGIDDDGHLLTKLPSPRGLSGGGSWLVPDFKAPRSVFLEGVFIECHEARYAFSTRLEHVIGFISHTHPGGVLSEPSRKGSE